MSGTDGNVNAVYLFSTVTAGVDAWVAILNKYNGGTISNIDQPGSSTGYDDAFQPIVGIAAGTSSTRTTSYVEWKIQFKKKGTSSDTVLSSVSATAIDIDGGSTLNEMVQAFNADSYSVDPNSGSELSITWVSNCITATSSTNNYTGIDTSNKSVMFQMNFSNVNSILYRTGGTNSAGATPRNTSIYFRPFFSNYSALPVKLVRFSAVIENDKKVLLRWTTTSELNNDYFTIEKSSDGKIFSELIRIPGAGNTSVAKNYSTADDNPINGTNFYRLRQTDFNGKSTFSKIISVQFNDNSSTDNLEIHNVSPNPFTKQFKVDFASSKSKEIEILLIDLSGKIIYKEKYFAREGNNTFQFNDGQRLKPGHYSIVMKNNQTVISEKIAKE